jgi:hypothetical protein
MINIRRQFIGRLTAVVCLAAVGLVAVPSLAQDDDDGPGNVFISPCGQPFRAPPGAPYPVATWFKQADKNGDGKLDHAEFMADADAFFDSLDLRHEKVLDGFDIQVYERRIAPEVLGLKVSVSASLSPRPVRDGARLWLAQSSPEVGVTTSEPPDYLTPDSPHQLDETGQGASPYSFFQEPEPVTAADFDLRGFITKANFLKLADMHFHDLDTEGVGYLTLDKLPKTAAQKLAERRARKH